MIKIIVASRAGEGKTAISTLIANTLRDNGINVELIDDNGVGIVEEPGGISNERLISCVTAISTKRVPVEVRTTQLARNEY